MTRETPMRVKRFIFITGLLKFFHLPRELRRFEEGEE
jgi:hypothetical protein